MGIKPASTGIFFRKPVGYGWVWPLLLGAVITYASSRPVVEGPWDFPLDKVVHFFLFGLVATLLFRFPAKAFKKLVHAVFAVAATMLFGLSDELHQFMHPARFFEGGDLVADSLGAIFAVTVYRFWPFYRNLLEKDIFQFTRLWLFIKSSKTHT